MRPGIIDTRIERDDIDGMTGTSKCIWRLTAGLPVVVAFLWVAALLLALRHLLTFDDSYMFYRYAMNMRHGLGVSWNPDGVHTYGETALLWGWVIFVLSYLPLSAEHVLRLASWMAGGGAFLAISYAVARNAESRYMKSAWRVLPMVALPMMAMPIVMHNMVTGMETMLGMALAGAFAGLAVGVSKGKVSAVWAGLCGLLAFMTRPELGLAVVLMPIILLSGRSRAGQTLRRDLFFLLGTFGAGVLVEMLCCHWYFGSTLPLSFYMKSWHAYAGYRKTWMPIESTLAVLQAWPYFAAIIILFRRSELRLVLSCVLPGLGIFAYLATVTQIMGMYSRYYLPCVPFFVVCVLLVLDRRLKDDREGFAYLWAAVARWPRVAALSVLAALCGLAVVAPKNLFLNMDRRLDGSRYFYDPVILRIGATAPLPKYNGGLLNVEFSEWMARRLPAGTKLAASEVGYLGIAAPRVNIIDLAGLNDRDIALHGFSVERLLAREPDIIWMPHSDYTYQRGVLLSNPELLRRYELYPDAANFGVAIRKDSALRGVIEKQLGVLWSHFYPGIAMSGYLAQSATWSSERHLVAGESNEAGETIR